MVVSLVSWTVTTLACPEHFTTTKQTALCLVKVSLL